MAQLKYIQLYEEYKGDLEEKTQEKLYSWNEVRDAIQSKLPFIIIDFESKESFDKCIREDLFDEKYVKQIYYTLDPGTDDVVKLPSVFIFGEGKDLTDRVLGLTSRYKIHRTIVGEFGKNVPQIYVDGENMDFDSNVVSTLDKNDVGDEDFYKIENTYYKFVN